MMSDEKLVFVAKIEEIGAISEDGKRQQTIKLKDVEKMEGTLFDERNGFVRITIEKVRQVPDHGAGQC